MAFDPITAVASVADTVIKRIWGEKASDADIVKLKNELLIELAKLDAAQLTGQLEINKVEAASPSLFVAGWRPCMGWVCEFAVAYTFIMHPISNWLLVLIAPGMPILPNIDSGQLMTLVMAMLGVGTLRTVEKLRDKDDTPPAGSFKFPIKWPFGKKEETQS